MKSVYKARTKYLFVCQIFLDRSEFFCILGEYNSSWDDLWTLGKGVLYGHSESSGVLYGNHIYIVGPLDTEMSKKNPDNPKPIVLKQGAVALFDVLGYQALLANNTLEKAVGIARQNLLALPETFTTSSYRALDLDPKGFLRAHVHDLEWAIFSDTIILALEFPSPRFPCPPNAPWRLRIMWDRLFVTDSQWIIFLNACAAIMRQLFIAGLPLRGAIHFGEYFIDGQCFAGKPIVAAYQDANLQDWCGCTVDRRIERHYKKILRFSGADKPMARWILVDYPVPVKRGRRTKRSVLNWVWLRGSPVVTKIRGDPDAYVRKSFCAHQKDIAANVEKKVRNTVAFVRHVTEGNALDS